MIFFINYCCHIAVINRSHQFRLINYMHWHIQMQLEWKSIIIYSCNECEKPLESWNKSLTFSDFICILIFKCTNALLQCCEANVCWGFSNCINTKIIGSNWYLHTETSDKWGEMWIHMRNAVSFLSFRFHFNPSDDMQSMGNMFDFFQVNSLLPLIERCSDFWLYVNTWLCSLQSAYPPSVR